MLRVSELTERIHHIPEILYHWRAIPGSIAAGTEQKSGVPELQARAVSAHLRRIGAAAIAVPHPTIPHRARLAPDPQRTIDPAELAPLRQRRDRRPARRWRPGARRFARCHEVSAHVPAEVIVVTAEPERATAAAGESRLRLVEADSVSSRAQAANLGARAASGEWLVFCSDAAEIVEPDWLSDLHLHASLPGVAAAGPLIARPDGRAEAAGFALALNHPVEPMLAGVDADADGYYGSLACARDVSAISAEFMLVRRAAFDEAGGFEPSFVTGFEDFDLCQRLRGLGHGIVYAPRPRVVVHETPAARHEALDIVDRALFVDRWYDRLGARRSVLQPQLLAGRGELRPGAMSSASQPVPAAEPMRLVIVYFGPFHVNSAIQAFHFASDLTDAGWQVTLAGIGDPGADPRGRRAELRVRHPPRPAGACTSASGAIRRPAIALAWTPRENVRAATEAFTRGLGIPYVVHLEDNEWHLYGEAVGRPIEQVRRLSLAEQDRLSPPTLIHPTRSQEFMRRRRRDHRDHRGAQRVQPRRPAPPCRPPGDRRRALPPRPRAAAQPRGARNRSRTSSCSSTTAPSITRTSTRC